MSINIAIDGPAGAGKSTIAKRLAKELSFVYVDTGAMYRAMAFYFLENGIDGGDEAAVGNACGDVEITIAYENGEQQVILNNRNVNDKIRTEQVSRMASITSAYPQVRKKLVELQKQMAKTTNVIMDGRDIGTCVLPEAQVKIYLTASVQTRAKRRYDEMIAKGENCSLAEIEADIKERDERDMNRSVSPLKQAEDAVLLDSSELDIDGVVAKMRQICKEKAGL